LVRSAAKGIAQAIKAIARHADRVVRTTEIAARAI